MPMYGIQQLFNGTITLNTTVDKLETEIAHEETDKLVSEFANTTIKERTEIGKINSQHLKDTTRNPIGGSKSSIFKVKNQYRSKYF
jgi:2-hydroxy-3-keto-5-methylthiopentenyl-1-phosphate phosphatase